MYSILSVSSNPCYVYVVCLLYICCLCLLSHLCGYVCAYYGEKCVKGALYGEAASGYVWNYTNAHLSVLTNKCMPNALSEIC